MGDMVAALRVGLERFAAISDPFHGLLQFARRPGHQRFLGIDDLLAAKTTADIGRQFVSVTQQFNTTSSMGRLTLNVLLSFAQFEREGSSLNPIVGTTNRS